MPNNISANSLQITQVLYDFIEKEAAPGTGISPDHFWKSLAKIVSEFAPRNRELLAKRDALQARIDAWHQSHDMAYYLSHRHEYKQFLQDIGYLVPEGEDFKVSTWNSDYEISIVAGPQLVVPVMNARYALNAANARWGSLFDALYGTDVIPRTGKEQAGYDRYRGQLVIDWADDFLDQAIPLENGRHAQVRDYGLINQDGHIVLKVELEDEEKEH